MQHKIIQLENEVQDSLSNLGLNVNILLEMVRKGYLATTSVTSNHPTNTAAIRTYQDTVCSSRDSLCSQGWVKKDTHNLPLICNSKNSVSIVIFSGDKNTGIKDKTPKSKNPRGKKAEQYINQNNIDITGQPRINIYEFTTWALIYYREKNYQVRSELSLPISMNSRRHINDWGERIILPPVWIGEKPVYSSQNQTSLEFDSYPNTDVTPKRRK